MRSKTYARYPDGLLDLSKALRLILDIWMLFWIFKTYTWYPDAIGTKLPDYTGLPNAFTRDILNYNDWKTNVNQAMLGIRIKLDWMLLILETIDC